MSNKDAPFLIARQIGHAFDDDTAVLTNVSLSIPQGAFVALMGMSGVGKSTLLRILAGLLPPTTGQVSLSGTPVYPLSTPLGIVFQRESLMPWRTVHENIHLPLELNANGQVAESAVQDIIELVGLAGFEDSYPAQLSGGMAQRVAIARALVHEPPLLLLDEPFGSLDALTRERMGQELLRVWRARPVTVVMVTHSIAEAVLLADEVLVLNGRPATITHHIPINLVRPRSFDVQRTAAFQDNVAAVRAAIRIDF